MAELKVDSDTEKFPSFPSFKRWSHQNPLETLWTVKQHTEHLLAAAVRMVSMADSMCDPRGLQATWHHGGSPELYCSKSGEKP